LGRPAGARRAKDGRLIVGSIFEPKILDCAWRGAP
jgi:hypothetical protein